MPYIGNSPKNNVRGRFYYTASASQTLFSGADIHGRTLKYQDGGYVDVYLNGVLLQDTTDYTATTKTSVSLVSGATAGDLVEIVAYGIFSVSDTVSASDGGTFSGNVVFTGTATFNGGTSGAGGGSYDGDNGPVNTGGKGDIFRVHEAELNTDVTIASGENALCAGPLTVATGKTITVNGNLVIA
jgi:hypothetical protein